MTIQCKFIAGVILLHTCGLTSSLRAQQTSDLINDQIAAHFSQVFSDKSEVYSPDKNSWVPGNDKDTLVPGGAWTVDASAVYVFKTGIEKNPGKDVTVSFEEVSIQSTIPIKPKHKVSFAFNTLQYQLSESGNASPDVVPVQTASKYDMGFMYRMGLNPRWELLAGGGLSFTESNEAEIGGKSTLLGYAGAAYTFDPSLTVAFAFSLSSREFQDKAPFPLFALDWRINDRNRLFLGDGLTYHYAINKEWKDVVGLEVNGTTVTLNLEDQVIAGHMRYDPALVVEDVGIAVTYSHTFDNGLIFTTRFGLGQFGEQSYYDNDEAIETLEFEHAFGLGVGLKYRF